MADWVDCVCCGDPIGSDYTLSPCCYQKVCLQCHSGFQAAFSCPNCTITITALPATDYTNQFSKSLLKRVDDLTKSLTRITERYQVANAKTQEEQLRLRANAESIMTELSHLVNAADLANQLETGLQAAAKANQGVLDSNRAGLKQLTSLTSYLTGVKALLHSGLSQANRLIELAINLETLGQRLSAMVAENVVECKLRLISSHLGPVLIQDRLNQQLKFLANEDRLWPQPRQSYLYSNLANKLAAVDLAITYAKLDLVEITPRLGQPADFLMVFQIEGTWQKHNKFVLVNSQGDLVYHREGYVLEAINHKWLIMSKDNRFYLEARPNNLETKSKLIPLALARAGKVKGNGNYSIQVVGLTCDGHNDILYLSRGYRLLTYHITAQGQLDLVAEVATTVRIRACFGQTCSYVVAESEMTYYGYFQPAQNILPTHQLLDQYLEASNQVTHHLGEGTFLVNEQKNSIKRMVMTETGPGLFSDQLTYRLRWFDGHSVVKLFSDGQLWYLGYVNESSDQVKLQVY